LAEPLIRKARRDDLPALGDIERDADKLFLQTDMPEIGAAEPTDSAALAALLDEGAFWVAELDGDPVGFLAAGTRQGQYVILQISVARSGQGRGVGARLMETAMAHGRATGAPDVILTTFRDIPWNAPWYARFGFEEIPEGERSPVVREMQAHEAANGLDMSRRCALRAVLSP
jgi:N-acetylglutamate synthase-like GNAT family acetyltransferase